MNTNHIVELHGVAKRFGDDEVLRQVSFSAESGDFLVIYGAPSSGKSVLMRLIAGLETVDSGRIQLRGADMAQQPASVRNIGYVPQSFALFPNFSVFDNIAYPLSLSKMDAKKTEKLVRDSAELLGIDKLLHRSPNELSGGQKQRVAIARGLVKETEIFLLDDPLVGLDFKLREKLIDDLKQTQKTLGVTFIYTTSDPVETLMLASKIAVLHEGEIVEVGEPATLYNTPQHSITMRTVSFPQANYIPATVDNGMVNSPLFNFPTRLAPPADKPLALGIRAEHFHLIAEPPEHALHCSADLLLREDLGGEEIVYLGVNGVPLTTVLRGEEMLRFNKQLGATVPLWIDPRDIVIFADDQRIGKAL